MSFRENDILELLTGKQQGKEGSYDQLEWSVYSGSDSTDITTKVISMHEFLHNDLNNITSYGILLRSMAYLAGEEIDSKDFFRNTLIDLITRCRLAHESYATWLGITVFRDTVGDNPGLVVLADNPGYQNYYRIIDELMVDIPNVFLRQQVVQGMLRSCFQSQQIANYALNNLASFNLSDITPTEFPDARIDVIFEDFTPKDPLRLIQNAINSFQVGPAKDLLTQAMEGKIDKPELLTEEHNWIADKIMLHVYHEMTDIYDHRGSQSLGDQEHLEFINGILPKLDELAPFKNSPNPIYINNKPQEIERGLLLSYENETLIMYDTPWPCIVKFPDKMEVEEKIWLLSGISEEPHVFIMGRHPLPLAGQYEFVYEEDAQWFQALTEPFTAIRYAAVIDGIRRIYLIPFDTPQQLSAFIQLHENPVPILGCVAMSAAYHDNWWETWKDLFNTFDVTAGLLDVSPLYHIEQIFPKAPEVYFKKFTLNTVGITHSAMAFQIQNQTEMKALMLAPATDMHCSVMSGYIQTKFPQFKHNTALDDLHMKWMPAILSHIFREEQCFTYLARTANLT